MRFRDRTLWGMGYGVWGMGFGVKGLGERNLFGGTGSVWRKNMQGSALSTPDVVIVPYISVISSLSRAKSCCTIDWALSGWIFTGRLDVTSSPSLSTTIFPITSGASPPSSSSPDESPSPSSELLLDSSSSPSSSSLLSMSDALLFLFPLPLSPPFFPFFGVDSSASSSTGFFLLADFVGVLLTYRERNLR